MARDLGIALARALLVNPTILVLDEPTASLDPIAERALVDGYETVMRGRTTIVITHRLDLALRADRVVVIDDARVVEEGTPGDLASRSSRFSDLFNVEYAV